MDEETTTENNRSVMSTVKTTAEVAILAYTATQAIRGFYGMAKDLKDDIKVRREAKKIQQEEV